MTTDHHENNLIEEFAEIMISQGSDSFRPLLEALLNVLMKVERNQAIQAQPYERSQNRKGYANGYKDKHLNSRFGELNLKVPKTRDLSFYPKCLEKGTRSERAIKLAVAEMYLKGVSTRRVQSITEALCGLEISSSQVSRATKELDEEFEAFRNRPLGTMIYGFFDAIYLKVRHGGSVIDMSCLIAYGIGPDGRREVLGASMSFSEAEVHWRDFFRSLQRRGLHGLRLCISDDHSGLREALRSLFPTVPWQRCQFHLSQNAQHYSPKKEMRGEIAGAMRSIFSAETKDEAETRKSRVIAQLGKRAPEFVGWLEANIEEGLEVLNFPQEHRKRIRRVNGLERVNKEIRRRTRVAVLFPNKESALRVVTGVLTEIHDEWVTGRSYLNMELLEQSVNRKS